MVIENCECDLPGSYFAWVEGSDVTIRNNRSHASMGEHIVRVSGASNVTIESNDFTNANKTVVNVQKGQKVVVRNNHIHGILQVGPLNRADGVAADRLVGATVEANTVTGGIKVVHGAENVVVMGNAVTCNNDPLTAGFAITVEGWSGDEKDKTGKPYGRGNKNIAVTGNKVTNDQSRGGAVLICNEVDGLVINENIYAAPKLVQGHYGSGGINSWVPLGANWQVENNTWPASHKGSYPAGAVCLSKEPLTADQWLKLPQITEDNFND